MRAVPALGRPVTLTCNADMGSPGKRTAVTLGYLTTSHNICSIFDLGFLGKCSGPSIELSNN